MPNRIICRQHQYNEATDWNLFVAPRLDATTEAIPIFDSTDIDQDKQLIGWLIKPRYE